MARPRCRHIAASAFIVLATSDIVGAQTPSQPIVLPPVVVTAPMPSPDPGPPAAASEVTVPGDQINARPVLRPGEALEAAPGLIVTQHSGEGKANQYFLRGFNLDHGTDLAIFVDGMPVNMRTHGHGQGYADINFLIPELLRGMVVRKGPYYAAEGDFSSAGAIRLYYLDRLDRAILQASGGSFGYWRGLGAGSVDIAGGTVLAAGEITLYDGPWDFEDRVRKFNGMLRYSQGTWDNGFAITGMAYHNRWNSTDQIARRAVAQGVVNRFGSLDPTDAGRSSRYSLSGRWSRSDESSASRVDGYVIRSTLNLFNNFTYFLDNPVDGDQFRQLDKRTILGLNASHDFKGTLMGRGTETRIGIQGRYDDIKVGLFDTVQRETIGTTRVDRVHQSSIGVYLQNTTQWTDWMRTILGVRGDLYWGSVDSDTPENSGRTTDFITSPKASLVFGPFQKTELFLNAGTGFHSNDIRGATIAVDPTDKTTPLPRVPLLVRSRGAEVGVRTQALPGFDSSLALFVLTFDSELVFVGDAGTTEASRPSRRMGIEWTNHYQVLPWLALDFDLAWTKARFTNADPAGDRIPGSPALITAAGIELGDPNSGWYGGLRWRYFGPRPLVEDNSVRSKATSLFSGRVGYAFENGIRVQLDAFNLLNRKVNQIEYFYTSRLPGEPPEGADDRHFHPAEPRAVRVTVAKAF